MQKMYEKEKKKQQIFCNGKVIKSKCELWPMMNVRLEVKMNVCVIVLVEKQK